MKKKKNSLGWLLFRSVLLELDEELLDAVKGVGELPAVELHNLPDDPFQQ